MSQKQKDFFKNGTGHIVSSSHNDIAWWNTPYRTMEYRDLNIISPAIDIVDQDGEFKHTMECVLYLMEYLQRHPEKKEKLHELAKERRLMWGATYTQPYEDMLNDEALVRQVYLGKRWFEKTFPGAEAKTAWSPDVPGRAMQFPQVLSKAGIDYLMISRLNAGAFEWFSPDGSSVKGFSMGHYFYGSQPIKGESLEEIQEKANATLTSARPHYAEHKLPPEYLFLSVADYAKPENFRDLIASWPKKENRKYDLPDLKHSSVEEFMEAVTADPESTYTTYCGERPNEWAYIHGATHHKGVAYGRKASVLLPQAEMYQLTDSLLSGDFKTYPAEQFEEAWKHVLYPDHGFGGGNGHITDKVFGNAMKTGCRIGEELREAALKRIASYVQVQELGGAALIVFNPNTAPLTDTVTCRLDIRKVPSRYFAVADQNGKEIEYQIMDEENAFELTIQFVAEDISGMGYKTYYIKPTKQPTQNIWLKETAPQRAFRVLETGLDVSGMKKLIDKTQTVENDFYTVVFGKGGIEKLYDKEQQKDLLDTSSYMGFELFMVHSEGTGAGEFEQIQQPDFGFSDEMKAHDCEWEITEEGTIRTSVRLNMKFSCCHIVQTFSIYHTVKKIDCDIDILAFDGTPYREIRFALPVIADGADITYDVPMGAVTIGRDEVHGSCGTEFFAGINAIRYPVDCREIHPREVQDWIAVHNADSHVVLSSDVSLFDYRSMKDDSPLIQPILLASRRSCHGWGNEYSQMGNHSYHFTLTSGSGDLKQSNKTAEYANHPLIPVAAEDAGHEKILPEELCFWNAGNPDLVISSIKKCEDDNSVIMRLYENYNEETSCRISSYFDVAELIRTDIIEREKEPADKDAEIPVGKRSIETFKLKMK